MSFRPRRALVADGCHLVAIGGSYYMLYETALGRQEDREKPAGRVEAAHAAIPDFAT
jgi:hypothetical protein